MMFAKLFKIRLSDDFKNADESLVNDFLESVIPKRVESGLIQHPTDPYWSVLVLYQPKEDVGIHEGERILFDSYEPLTPDEEMIYLKLKAWRNKKAEKEEVPPFQVLHDAHLMTLDKLRPQTMEQLDKLKGVSNRKLEKYREDILGFFRRE